MHELYCAGHLIQGAVAHHRATGARAFLDVAIRLADHIVATFNPSARQGADGHPEIEMALVELARATGDERYLRQAQFFVDQRGQRPPTISGKEYHQDHAPVRGQREVVGHAVRALYLYAGMADLYAQTGERALWESLEALWRNLQGRKIYITGGAGARHEGEAFGDDYELPNAPCEWKVALPYARTRRGQGLVDGCVAQLMALSRDEQKYRRHGEQDHHDAVAGGRPP